MPYAKSVAGKTGIHGARPDPGDLFDREFPQGIARPGLSANFFTVLMARKDDKESDLGISSMLLYHAAIIIHGEEASSKQLILWQMRG